MMKVCRLCLRAQPDDCFFVRKETGRLRAECKKCHALNGTRWASANHAKRKAIALKYYRNNKPKARQWKRENKERAKRWDREHPAEVRAMKRRWSRANPVKVLANVRHRQATQLKATPPWADRKAIQVIYENARMLGREVDHLVPLRSPLVCGLHVPANLVIVEQSVNRAKSNRWWPGMLRVSQ